MRNSVASTADTSWLAAVATAAPATPMLKPQMSSRSSTIFVADATARYSSDRLELPTALRMPAVML